MTGTANDLFRRCAWAIRTTMVATGQAARGQAAAWKRTQAWADSNQGRITRLG